MTTPEYPPGTLIDGRYEIRAHLGQGGMGSVYRAHDLKVGQMVALKMMTGGGSEKSKEDRRMRFAREIVAINGVRHPNVLHIQEFGFHKDTPYMVMELLEGRDLAAVLAESDRPLDVEYAADIMLAVCAAIRACHASQVIHRDLKPGNIMIVHTDVGAGWDVRVVDFGISKTADSSDMTQTGKIVGTPHFLAPEQIIGEAGPASDQYAIGVLLYVCLTRRRPYHDLNGLPLIRAIEKGGFTPPRALNPEIPEAIEAIVLKAMHLEPAQRYASVFDLGRALWPFASAMGQQFWKRYYETPPADVPRARPTASTSVPLVQRMAEGEVNLPSATVHAHYHSTTAVAIGDGTLDQASAVVAAPEPQGSRTKMTLHTPSGWQWESSSSKVAATAYEDSAVVRPPAAPGPAAAAAPAPRARSRALVIAGAAAAALAIVVVVARSSGGRATAGDGTPARTMTGGATSAAAPPAPAAVAPPAPLPPAPAALPAQAEAPAPPKSTHRPRHHSRASKAAAGEWATDPAGNLVPPP